MLMQLPLNVKRTILARIEKSGEQAVPLYIAKQQMIFMLAIMKERYT
jgi:hypothetical protein